VRVCARVRVRMGCLELGPLDLDTVPTSTQPPRAWTVPTFAHWF
jgi:hypothetical protein